MKLRKLLKFIRGQNGFTLIELIVTLAITSVISLGTTMSVFQMTNRTNRNTEYITASQQTMNAIYWIGRDAQMSQNTKPSTTNATGFPLQLEWTEWDTSRHQVIYSIEGDTLKRSYTVNGTTPVDTMVAQYINSQSENTTCEYIDKVLTINVTSTVGTGTRAVSVSKLREITPRPGI
jgi:prepilin-type N-terminal cleavage/methylation domain-containing protein